MWPFKAKPKADPTDKLITAYEKSKERTEKIERILDTRKPKKSRAELIAEAFVNYDESTRAIENAPQVPVSIREFAIRGAEAAFYRDFHVATG